MGQFTLVLPSLSARFCRLGATRRPLFQYDGPVAEKDAKKKVELLRQGVLDLPRAIKETLAEVRPAVEKIVRGAQWTEFPIYLVGDSSTRVLGLAGRYAIETILGWPVTVRTVREMECYSAPLKPRTPVLLIPGSDDPAGMISTALKAKRQGARLWVLTEQHEGELEDLADGLIPICGENPPPSGIPSTVLKLAALNLFALTTGQILKPPRTEFKELEEEFRQLPRHLDTLLHEKRDAARLLGEKLRQARTLLVLGGGFYFPVAWNWASALRDFAGLETQVSNLMDPPAGLMTSLPERIHPLVVLSGSRSLLRDRLRILADRMENALCELVVISDSQDQRMIQPSTLALLIPTMSEMVGSVAMLATLQLAASFAARKGGSRD